MLRPAGPWPHSRAGQVPRVRDGRHGRSVRYGRGRGSAERPCAERRGQTRSPAGCRSASKNAWTSLIAIEPSPTAEATRLIEPWRTSPRRRPRACWSRAAAAALERPAPVALEVRPGQDEAAARPDEVGRQPVGVRQAPIIRNSASALDRLLGSVGAGSQDQALQPAVPPPPPTTSVPRRTSMFGAPSICAPGSATSPPRATSPAPRASPGGHIRPGAAPPGPAELAPPTTYASSAVRRAPRKRGRRRRPRPRPRPRARGPRAGGRWRRSRERRRGR